jgi:hypothetical protein
VRNLAVKFAWLSACGGATLDRPHAEVKKPNPQLFMDLAPVEMLQRYKRMLHKNTRGILLFGFSDAAFLAILDEEFEVDMEREQLFFRKTFLDARSIRLAGIYEPTAEGLQLTPRQQILLENAANRLLESTRHLYRQDMHSERLNDVQREYQESILSYMQRRLLPEGLGYAVGNRNDQIEGILRLLLASDKNLRAFCHAMTADALFKTDAAAAIFGPSSGYAQAWKRKQIFRQMLAESLQIPVNGMV